MIPYGRQDINQSDIDAVIDTLTSDWLTQGPKVPEFEAAITEICDVEHAVALSNATAALHISCLALDVGENDIVWTSPISFVASANCALYCGATVDFVDIDQSTGNMCIKALERKLIGAKHVGLLPKVVIPVHLAGQSCDMESIYKLSLRFGFKIIEDASHAIGAMYKETQVGSCQYSDITVFSFHPVKIITTAEGGCATTKSPELAKTLRQLRSHGITGNPSELEHDAHGPWYYEQQRLGFNYRMTDLQAALGVSQLTRLTRFIERRNQLAKYYQTKLTQLPCQHLAQSKDVWSAYHLFIVLLENSAQQKAIIQHLRNNGVIAHLHYIPIYKQPYYQKLGFPSDYCPNAESYYARAITLPLHPNLTESEIDYIVEQLEACI